MRMLPIALCIMLLLLLSSVAQAPFVAPSAAQTKTNTNTQVQSKEALYVKCRSAIFRKYGQPGAAYHNARPGYRVLPYTSGSRIDQCVANGGRVD
jgi:hypothetical protein